MALYGEFGEFGSADEINELAKNLLTEGDKASIKAVAKENGIPEDYAEMFISGEIPALCDAQTAAVGKIEIEAKDLNPKDIMVDWVEYIKWSTSRPCVLKMTAWPKQSERKGRRLKGVSERSLSGPSRISSR